MTEIIDSENNMRYAGGGGVDDVDNIMYKTEDKNKTLTISNEAKQNIGEKFIIHLILGFREICIVTAALPLVTLFLCFVTAYVFQSEEVHETHCRVYNIIPSISAITGVSPQRYFWRICIALHIGPRFIIAACYRNYYMNLLNRRFNTNVDYKQYKYINYLISIVYWLHFIEITALCGVTYVSNRENYPIHEKIFIIFMTCSLCHMLTTIKLWEMLQSKSINVTSNQSVLSTTAAESTITTTAKKSSASSSTENGAPETDTDNTNNNNNNNNHLIISESEKYSLKLKKYLFLISIGSTIGLILFFLKHRLLCHDMAFSWFALCEYIIATANMAFHCTTMLDFPLEQMIIVNNPLIDDKIINNKNNNDDKIKQLQNKLINKFTNSINDLKME